MPKATHRRKRRIGVWTILQGLLAIAGFGMFTMMVRQVDLSAVGSWSRESLPYLIVVVAVLAVINYSFDTLSWWLVCGEKRPSFFTLMSIRARCEAVTNLLPGGALIGEPMKAAALLRATSMTRAEAATSFLLSKLVLIVGHVGYVVGGLALSYVAINAESERIFGTSNMATIALGAAIGIVTFLGMTLGAMVWLRPFNRLTLKNESHGWRKKMTGAIAEMQRIELLLAHSARKEGGRLLIAMLCAFVAWSLNAVEAFVILRWLGVDLSFSGVYAIDGVSSVVRMIVFVLPIGIGGQDWAISGLMTIHGVMQPLAAAQLVVIKRAREFFVVGIGLCLMVLAMRRGESVAPQEVVAEEAALDAAPDWGTEGVRD